MKGIETFLEDMAILLEMTRGNEGSPMKGIETSSGQRRGRKR